MLHRISGQLFASSWFLVYLILFIILEINSTLSFPLFSSKPTNLYFLVDLTLAINNPFAFFSTFCKATCLPSQRIIWTLSKPFLVYVSFYFTFFFLYNQPLLIIIYFILFYFI